MRTTNMARFSMMQRSQTKRDPPSSSATHRNRTETEVEDGGHNTERLAGRTTVGTPLLELGACFCPFPGSVATLELSIDGLGTGVACPPRSHQTAASGSARNSLRHARRGRSAACGAHAWPITEISSQSASIIHHTWSISRGDGEEGRRRAQHGTAQHSTAQPCLAFGAANFWKHHTTPCRSLLFSSGVATLTLGSQDAQRAQSAQPFAFPARRRAMPSPQADTRPQHQERASRTTDPPGLRRCMARLGAWRGSNQGS